jgi:hypothetical protein
MDLTTSARDKGALSIWAIIDHGIHKYSEKFDNGMNIVGYDIFQDEKCDNS